MRAMTPWQRLVRRRLHSLAGMGTTEPLRSEDWAAFFEHHTRGRGAVRIFAPLPGAPRCRICGAPLRRPGSRLVGPLGYRPSRKNPHMCDVHRVRPAGRHGDRRRVLFADVRGYVVNTASRLEGEPRGPDRPVRACRQGAPVDPRAAARA